MLRIMRSRGRKMMMLRTFHKSTEIHRENAQAQGTTQTLCEPAQSKCTWTFHKSHFAREFTGKMPGPKTATQPLCEPAQSKRTRTFHKSHFIRKFAGKMPQTDELERSDQALAFTLTARTLSVDTLFGET